MYAFSGKSLQKLDGVHPDLVRVAKRVITKSPVDFGISEGVREYARQVELVEQRKSTTLHSKHLIQESTGYAHAIDVFAYIDGKAVWQPKHYGPIVQAFITESAVLGVQLRFGHLWKTFQDSAHIELNSRFY